MHYYPHNIGDFDKATRHLTRIERSIYRDMIEIYYDTESKLTLDIKSLCRIVLARTDEEVTAVEQMLNEFFTQTADGWFHERCETEIEKYKTNISQKAKAGIASALAREAKHKQTLDGKVTPAEHTLNGCATKQELELETRTINNKQELEPKESNSKELRETRLIISPIQIPDWIPVDAWNDFVDSRKKLKKPLTQVAIKLAISSLSKLKSEGSDPKEVLEQSILNGYSGLFPVKSKQLIAEKTGAAYVHWWDTEEATHQKARQEGVEIIDDLGTLRERINDVIQSKKQRD
jgi:uncharacterized protein YdaU (DUF1376 family)